MRRNKWVLLFLTVMILGLTSCGVDSNQDRPRLFIVQEIKLDDGRSLFWFWNEHQGSGARVSYFQIASDKCDLSIEKAIAHCSSPIQIYDTSKDTIFILTNTSLVFQREDSKFHFKAVPYSPELYDIYKDPDSRKQFFLDSLCSLK